jgi:hypothetical protein
VSKFRSKLENSEKVKCGGLVDARDAGQIVEWAAAFIQTISETFDRERQ